MGIPSQINFDNLLLFFLEQQVKPRCICKRGVVERGTVCEGTRYGLIVNPECLVHGKDKQP